MKVLVIDSHKSTKKTPSENLHWVNAQTIATELGGDLIWSYPTVNDEIQTGYDAIVFVHSSPYSYEDRAWLEQNPNAKLFFVTNEYNLGEPSILWKVAKAGRKYEVIANHPAKASKVVEKYTSAWHNVNLNALCYKHPRSLPVSSFGMLLGLNTDRDMRSTIYYGSFRKGREKYFQKWLTCGAVTVSTHMKNREKFAAIGCNGPFINRISFAGRDLDKYGYSLYIEDEKTHTHYNYMANRFYEALSHGVVPLFDPSCQSSVELSGVVGATYVEDPSKLAAVYDLAPTIPDAWHQQAQHERRATLDTIKKLITGE